MNVTAFCISAYGIGLGRCNGRFVKTGSDQGPNFESGPYVDFVPKGCRKARRLRCTLSTPYLVVFEGLGIPFPPPPFKSIPGSEQVSMFSPPGDDAIFDAVHFVGNKELRSFDPSLLAAFDAFLATIKARIIADFRPKPLINQVLRIENGYSEVGIGRQLIQDGALANERLDLSPDIISEGAPVILRLSGYERDERLRRSCIKAHGTRCSVCRMDFGERYGPLGHGFIHVHHLRPLADVGEEHDVDPINDMRPVCPNCHSMLHRRAPVLEIDELKALLKPGVA